MLNRLLLPLLLFLSVHSHAQVCTLDLSFDSDGLVSIPVDSAQGRAMDVAVQSDAKLVVVGRSGNDTSHVMTIVRLNQDGSLDAPFGTGGVVKVFAGDSVSIANAVTIQPDGRILVTGFSSDGGREHLTVVRLQPDGSLDSTFGNGGVVVSNFFPFERYSRGEAIALRSDGKIIVAGTAEGYFSGYYLALLCRYHTNGELDSTFSGDGHISLANNYSTGRAVLVLPDDRIVVVGSTTNGFPPHFMVARCLPGGDPDPSFSGDGYWTTTYTGSSTAYAIGLQPDQKLVAAGYFNSSGSRILRFDTTGVLDASFGGEVQVPGNFTVRDLIVHPSGPVIASGYAPDGVSPGQWDFCMAAHAADGSVLSAFGTNGRVHTEVTPVGSDYSEASLLQPDGKIVLAGVSAGNDFALARYDLDLSVHVADVAPPRMSISVQPNPFHGSTALRITAPVPGIMTLNVEDALGQNVRSFTQPQSGQEGTTTPLDLTGLPPGCYLLIGTIDGYRACARLLVE